MFVVALTTGELVGVGLTCGLTCGEAVGKADGVGLGETVGFGELLGCKFTVGVGVGLVTWVALTVNAAASLHELSV